MGQQPYLMRLALGRSHDLPPDWEALSDTYELVSGSGDTPLYRCIDEDNEQSYGLTFDAKGRPYSAAHVELEKAQDDAVDSVTSIAVAAEHHVSSKFTENFDDDDFDEHAAATFLSERQWQSVERTFTAALTVGPVIVDVYLSSLLMRLNTQLSIRTLPLTQVIAHDIWDRSLLLSVTSAFAARIALIYLRPLIEDRVESIISVRAKSKNNLISLTTCVVEHVVAPLRWFQDIGLLNFLPALWVFGGPAKITHEYRGSVPRLNHALRALLLLESYVILRSLPFAQQLSPPTIVLGIWDRLERSVPRFTSAVKRAVQVCEAIWTFDQGYPSPPLHKSTQDDAQDGIMHDSTRPVDPRVAKLESPRACRGEFIELQSRLLRFPLNHAACICAARVLYHSLCTGAQDSSTLLECGVPVLPVALSKNGLEPSFAALFGKLTLVFAAMAVNDHVPRMLSRISGIICSPEQRAWTYYAKQG